MGSKSLTEIFKETGSQENGLAQKEAQKRIVEFGPNVLPEAEIPGIASVFLSQFLSPLIYVLLAAAAMVLAMGDTADGLIILFVLFFNAIVGTIQEGRAQNTLRALRVYARGTAAVVRDDREIIVSDEELVPGDVIVLREGEKVPADARLIAERSLRVDEASLTGESIPVGKVTGADGDKCIVYKGTNVVGGTGRAVVTATGLKTRIGAISQSIASIDVGLPLKENIAYLSRIIILVVGAITAVIFISGILRGEGFGEMFATVVSLAVSVIPEGLPIVMTLVLASGVWRMSKQHVLVKKLQAVEGLGQAKIIAVDKTGTLTKNEIVLKKVLIGGKTYEVSGTGYESKGAIFLDDKEVDPLNHPDLVLAGRIAHFCSDAEVMYMEKEGIWKVAGDPTEAALSVFAKKIGFPQFELEAEETFELPFESNTRYHLEIHALGKKHFLSIVGAPERILELSKCVWRGRSEELLTKEREELAADFLALSKDGYRVLAFGMNPDVEKTLPVGVIPEITFVGFFAMRDELREEAKGAIDRARAAGIRVVMITGDHKVTAAAIAKEADILDPKGAVITGEEIERLSDDELMRRFATCNVFARVTPEQKLKIIGIFKKRGEIIAMTGDGVNDAPSLAAADLGVAMGKIGTEVAKEAADLVLLDDNFGNIVSAIEEGRSIYRTIRKVLLYLFSTGVGEVLTIGGSMFLGLPLPILPAQIIWLNFVTDGFLDVSLAMEPKEEGLLSATFKKPSPYILDAFSAKRMFFMGVIIAAGTLLIFSQYLGMGIEKALTVSLTTLAVFQWFNAWNCKSENRSIFLVNPLKNLFLVGATIIVAALQLLAIYNPTMQRILHTVPLDPADWIYIFVIAGSIIFFEEARKAIARLR
ncbi:MAG: HAD-IC family P-type ATPase [Candidatus Liptonbacteria bacterium]|nr:HAD-IC family P-type ATPase [Candidatus Liptonbacteria bacterium]